MFRHADHNSFDTDATSHATDAEAANAVNLANALISCYSSSSPQHVRNNGGSVPKRKDISEFASHLRRSGFWKDTAVTAAANANTTMTGGSATTSSQHLQHQITAGTGYDGDRERDRDVYSRILRHIDSTRLRGLFTYALVQCRRARIVDLEVTRISPELFEDNPLLRRAMFICLHHYVI